MAKRTLLSKTKLKGISQSLKNLDQNELYECVFAGIKSSLQFQTQRFPTRGAFFASLARDEEDDHRTQELVTNPGAANEERVTMTTLSQGQRCDNLTLIAI